jgi:hypothetical protein
MVPSPSSGVNGSYLNGVRAANARERMGDWRLAATFDSPTSEGLGTPEWLRWACM